ncbi:unnamed protein product [Adineta steineri]|uniref:Uncharacterized protein n=1 Tax=Adineta steineri TaxID=433720 RepID=A0A819Z531_9BILA|nr:unnamed protein product [Adineta steineri]CAF1053635.1 unnamed protein product [Adineta steineri]CAF3830020.1 unnamed protein product [Adineta steineri]CAF4168249.1 unnamed protein product [Adineta steineri]
MANSTDAKKSIRNVDVDQYNIVTGHLASTGANTCIIIIVLFKENNKIFVEHQNYFPDKLDDINMKICLTYVASHVDELNKPKANISSVYILGGVKKESDSEDKQRLIEKLIKENDIHNLSTYVEIIKNIKLVNARNDNITQIASVQYCSKLPKEIEEQLYQTNSIANFKTSMLNVGATELCDNNATYLSNV